ncbi:AAA family ATPase [Stenotrophomonas muris]|uniref:AAA family ATPase n=1 Tax=Stenotrophomonas muris TaxID=2963283 RepID=UPI0039C7171E
MPIERIVIDNFKSFRHLDLPLNAHMNLVVGDNEVGKSTLLEAIHAVVTGQLQPCGLFAEAGAVAVEGHHALEVAHGIVLRVERERAHVLHTERGGGLGQGVNARFAIDARAVPAIEPDRSTLTIGDPRDVQAGVEHERAP